MTVVHRLRRAPPSLVDAVLAVVLAGLTWGSVLIDDECPCSLPWWAVALILGQTLPLALRRRAPIVVWLVVGLATGVYGAAELVDPPIFFGGVVGLYTVACVSSRRTSYTVAALTAGSILAATLASGDTPFVTVALNFAVFGTAWVLGDSIRVRRAYTAELEDRAARLEWERQEEARRAAAGERVRIARELHDVVAHHVSVIALQSQAAEVLLPDEPDRAAEVVDAIGETARQALGELRRLLGALRQEGEGAPSLAPQPGLDQLETLAESVRQAGVSVQLSVVGDPRPVPPGVGLSVFRIVQEALTNVLKHASARRADVTVRYEDDIIAVRVTDDGEGSPDAPGNNGQGHGLIGMRERVALFGGELCAGPDPGGGFTVDARLPLVER